MAEITELPLATRLFVRTYRWRRIDPVPWAALPKPLPEARVALVSSGGFHLPSQKPFDPSVKGGDWSFREVPGSVTAAMLVQSHRSSAFDPRGIEADANLGFPVDRLREMAAAGEVGEVAPRHLSFMGSITAPARLVRESAPAAASVLREDGVDAAILVPV